MRGLLVSTLTLTRWGLVAALLHCGTATTFAADRTAALMAAFNSITSDEVKDHVAVLANDTFEGREGGSRGGHAAAKYLVEYFKRAQLQPGGDNGGYFQAFVPNHRNILGVLPGSDDKLRHEFVLIGAHYDHVGYGNATNSHGPWGYVHNGADDNASGTSGLLEVVDAFSKLPQAPRRTVLFALWDAEEKGLLGSQHWVDHPTMALRNVHMTINMDMIGRLRDERIELHGSRTSTGLREFVTAQNTNVGAKIFFTWEMKNNSDHYSFYQKRLPTLLLHTGLHDDYHRPSDDVEKLNYPGIERVSRLAFLLTHELANEPQSRPFREASRQENPAAQEAFETTQAPPPIRLGVDWSDAEADKQIVVARVRRGTPADDADIRVGDRITHFDNRPLDVPSDLSELLQIADSKVTLTIDRPGEPQALVKTLELKGRPSRWGMTWREDEAEPNSVTVVRVLAGSASDKGGLKRGDRIRRIAGHDIRVGDNLITFMTELPQKIDVIVDRDGRELRLTLKSMKPAVKPES
jgi:hypothetical protein